MKPNCQEPTCFNCSKEKKCDRGDGTINCIRHPKAREYLMQDVINDLMGIASVYRNENDDYANGIEKAIALIRDGVK